jgi:Cache 3/Cache 2 fusion domain
MTSIMTTLLSAFAAPRTFDIKASVFGLTAFAFCLLPMLLTPGAGHAEDARVAKSMAAFKAETTKLGVPKIEGRETAGGKDVPALHFGSTKINNNVAVVDEVAKKGGEGVAATVFVKDGDDFVRIATTLAKPDKTGRAIGTVLEAGPALDALKAGKKYNGDVSLFNKPYVASYEPITDASGAVIGAYFVGAKK